MPFLKEIFLDPTQKLMQSNSEAELARLQKENQELNAKLAASIKEDPATISEKDRLTTENATLVEQNAKLVAQMEATQKPKSSTPNRVGTPTGF